MGKENLKSELKSLRSASPTDTTLAAVQIFVSSEPISNQRRDTLSALVTVERVLQKPLHALPAHAGAMQRLFAQSHATQLGLKEKRYANVRSLTLGAIRRWQNQLPVRQMRLELSPGWKALFELLPNDLSRNPLNRLASFCTMAGIAPRDISPEALRAFRRWMEEEGLLRYPYRTFVTSISHWNLCAKRIPAWPGPARLSVPDSKPAFMRPWSAFPKSLQVDFEKLVARLVKPDVFAEDAPPRPLRPASIRNIEVIVRRFASALIEIGLDADKLKTLNALLPSFESYENTLKFLHKREGKEIPTEYLAKHARTMMSIAVHHCHKNDKTLSRMKALCARLEKQHVHELTQGNREKLRQFDDIENVRTLLEYPQNEHARAKRAPNPERAAKCVERALAASLLIHCCLRLFNLRTLKLSDFRWQKSVCYLTIPAERVKNRQQLEFHVQPEMAMLLREFIEKHRPLIAGRDNEYLFAGRSGRPRHQNSLREALQVSLLRRTGLRINPHLFRHVIAKVATEIDPRNAIHMSRMLGHTTVSMTYRKYLGTEGRIAGELIDKALQVVKDRPLEKKSRP